MAPYTHISRTLHNILQILETRCKSPLHFHQIQAQLIIHNILHHTAIAQSFITAAQHLSLLESAFKLYIKLSKPRIFICNLLLRALSHSGSPLNRKSSVLYARMHRNSVLPNHYTLPFILKCLSDLKELRQGKCVHNQILKLGYFGDVYVQNSLMNMYGSCGDMGSARKVFDEMSLRDVVSWTTMITGYREVGEFDHALNVFERMRNAGVVPNRVTMVNALAACASIGSLDVGVWIHEFVEREGWELDVGLGTSLIDMYRKCGKVDESLSIFHSMSQKNVFTWNTVIKGLVSAKRGLEALRLFFRMEHEGFRPDEVTLITVLSACVCSRLVEQGREIFTLLVSGKYGFQPDSKHYACMVDLLVRSGRLQEAKRIIDEMPFAPTKNIWEVLLAGCRMHGDVELSELAARKLVKLAPKEYDYDVILSDLNVEKGQPKDEIKA